MPSKLPIAVLISGGGTNLQALIDASTNNTFGCRIVGVISDRPNAGGLDRAASAGIPAEVIDWDRCVDRVSFTTAVCDKAQSNGAQALVLAGLMRILAPEAVERFPNAILNVHPSMLPAFPGGTSVQDALDAGVAMTGVTIHFVDELVDHGPIIVQEPVPILAGRQLRESPRPNPASGAQDVAGGRVGIREGSHQSFWAILSNGPLLLTTDSFDDSTSGFTSSHFGFG